MAHILDGKACAAEFKTKCTGKSLYIISIGNDPASKVYIRNKIKACEEVGIKCYTSMLDENILECQVITLIWSLNSTKEIDGIMVQLPLPKHLNTERILNAISPEKDVDGLTHLNIGKLMHGDPTAIVPCTPLGIVKLLKHNNIDIASKHCVIVGRSNIVGKPMAGLLLNEDATVTVCHSKTKNLKEITKTADILIVAIGKPKFITAEYVKPGAVVVDVGINRVDGKLCGDVDFESVEPVASAITPVPGGVGPMTVAMLLENVRNINEF